jgi:CYTH domain-containing protein
VVAEVELAPTIWERGLPELELPAWCVLELTGRHELSNAALARSPLVDWPEAQRRQLLEALK